MIGCTEEHIASTENPFDTGVVQSHQTRTRDQLDQRLFVQWLVLMEMPIAAVGRQQFFECHGILVRWGDPANFRSCLRSYSTPLPSRFHADSKLCRGAFLDGEVLRNEMEKAASRIRKGGRFQKRFLSRDAESAAIGLGWIDPESDAHSPRQGQRRRHRPTRFDRSIAFEVP